jgi:hypothetical protein
VVAAPLKVVAELLTLVNLAAVAIVCRHYTRVLAGAEFEHREALDVIRLQPISSTESANLRKLGTSLGG